MNRTVPHRIMKWEKTIHVTFNLSGISNDPVLFFNCYVVPVLLALDNQYEHERNKSPNVVKWALKARLEEKSHAMVIQMKIGEVDKEAMKEEIEKFVADFNTEGRA